MLTLHQQSMSDPESPNKKLSLSAIDIEELR
jgi:hypothetical protein